MIKPLSLFLKSERLEKIKKALMIRLTHFMKKV